MVYVLTESPSDEPSGRAQVGAGSNATRLAGLALGGPISPSTAGRVSVHRYADNGFRRNAFLGSDDTNRREELTVRGKLDWRVSDGWLVRLSGFHADFNNGYDAFALDNGPVTQSDEPGQDRQQTAAGALRVEGRLASGTRLVSITTAADSEVLFSFDGDWVNEQSFLPIIYDFRYRNPRNRRTVSQELRLLSSPEGRLLNATTDWVIGVFAQRLNEDNAIDSTGDYIETAVGCDPGVCFADRQISSQFQSRTVAVFAGIDSRLTQRLSLAAGLRLERWSANYQDSVVDNVVAPGVTARNRFSPTEPLLGGHLSLMFDWDATTRSYLRLARGFKAGGFNPSLAALGGSPVNVSYDPEALWNLELGLKGATNGGRLSYELAAFGMLRDNAQLSQSAQAVANDPNTFVFTTDNGDARVLGLEASVVFTVGAGLDLHGSLGLLDSRIDRWQVRPEVEGRDLAHAPGYTANLGASWSGPAGWSARLDITAVDAFYFDISNDQRSGAYQLTNLRVTKSWASWAVALWARNLFDKDYATRGFFFGNEPPAFAPALYTRFGDPRQVGLTLDYNF
ncbi:MAG: TonB-dependent receptor, partial [Gammaproteobacteria bacterium]|jgi:outer membrane receptor for ferrienterochelin and colicin|nr:TonB-dependent receptor [Gammaproteobacteria bacterium]